ncbi:RTA1-like protein [Mycena filopes]|nr:RTA1-like protein [Mycena filopes]
MSFLPRLPILLALLLTLTSLVEAKRKQLPCPADPFLDPKNDPCNGNRYIASNALTAVAFALIVSVALTQTFFIRKWGAKFMLAMTIGAYTFAFGIGTRFGLHTHPDSKGIYIVEYLFVVLSPCAFIAAEYVLLGRLARYLQLDHHLMVSPRRITWVFISSDITTFPNPRSVSISADTLSEGEILQLASFLTFTCIFFVFINRVRTREPATWAMHSAKKWYQDWRALAGAMCFSFLGILVDSFGVYRVAELSQGYNGHLATTERFFYGLDTLPLFFAISIYVLFWPGRFIGDGFPRRRRRPPLRRSRV